ncbi:LbetaH domain-containing protein [Methanohalophilus mahii]|uniref:Transferase hexapeptide repeat containing protein n=1 Tax=Methanohalophilus mahii (strain ATCC 35705 / DSM 5219 / SLP) TaxID=547558 RepID=D5EAX7_METMS|nr:carbonate dehydratase [Methanohalophilus mahii]ADE36328.1 transferase hexapeptide repeat containing protein [Methanohalophilus mahii DSM 5219]
MENPAGDKPKIDDSAWIADSAVVMGNVKIEAEVLVAPNAVIRADEPGASIVIGKGCNIQDNVVLHGVEGSKVVISEGTSLAHGCIVHGPCQLGKRCFIGFGAVVFDSVLEDDVVVLHNATVQGVHLPASKSVPVGHTVLSERDVTGLPSVGQDLMDFKHRVSSVNLELVEGYRKMDTD